LYCLSQSTVSKDFESDFQGYSPIAFPKVIFCTVVQQSLCLSALTLFVGQQKGHPACKNLSGGMLVWLSVWARSRFAQMMPLPLTISCSSKSRLVLPSWFLPF